MLGITFYLYFTTLAFSITLFQGDVYGLVELEEDIRNFGPTF